MNVNRAAGGTKKRFVGLSSQGKLPGGVEAEMSCFKKQAEAGKVRGGNSFLRAISRMNISKGIRV